MWQSLPELTLPLRLLSSPNPRQELIRTRKNVLERFVTQLYGVYQEITIVDAVRLYLFQHKGSDFEHMMLCLNIFSEWPIRVDKSPDPVSPTNLGWQQKKTDTAPTPVYTRIPIISINLPELVMCHCKRDCIIPCKCFMCVWANLYGYL